MATVTLLDSVECEALRNASVRVRPEPADRPEGVKASFAIFYLLETLLVINVAVFVFFKYLHPARRELYRLQHRPTVYVVMSSLGASFVPLTGSYFQASELRSGVPCWIFLFAYFLNVPLIVFPIASQLLHLYRKRQWTKAVVFSAQNTKLAATDEHEMSSTAGSETSGLSARGFLMQFLTVLNVIFCQESRKAQIKNSSAISTGLLLTRAQQDRQRVLRFLKSDTGANLTLTLFCLPYAITVAVYLGTSEYVRRGCWGCVPEATQEAVLIAESVVALIIIVVAFRINVKSEDPYHYVQEARVVFWAGGIWAVLFLILSAALRAKFKYSDFQFVMLVEISVYIISFVQTVLQVILALRESKTKISDQKARKECEYTMAQFDELFLAKSAPFQPLFAKHLESEFSYENVAFLESVAAWEENYYDLSAKTVRARAKRIANMFIGDKAELPVNLPAHIIGQVLSAIGNHDRDIHKGLFGPARAEIVSLLYRDSFQRFIRSNTFKQQVVSGNLPLSTNLKRVDGAVDPGL